MSYLAGWPCARYRRVVADLLISRERPGVALIKTVDPFDTLEIHRIERAHWKQAPETPGIYLLYGTGSDGKLTTYIGKSETNLRARIAKHHANPTKTGSACSSPYRSPPTYSAPRSRPN